MSEKHKDLFGQVLVALVTPMTPDGEVDWAATEKHLDYVISNGADGVVVTGTTGETSTLTDAEKLQLVKRIRVVRLQKCFTHHLPLPMQRCLPRRAI